MSFWFSPDHKHVSETSLSDPRAPQGQAEAERGAGPADDEVGLLQRGEDRLKGHSVTLHLFTGDGDGDGGQFYPFKVQDYSHSEFEKKGFLKWKIEAEVRMKTRSLANLLLMK